MSNTELVGASRIFCLALALYQARAINGRGVRVRSKKGHWQHAVYALRHDYDWPIETVRETNGDWWYRLSTQPQAMPLRWPDFEDFGGGYVC